MNLYGRFLAIALGGGLVAGCDRTVQALNFETIDVVIAKIKEEIGDYQATSYLIATGKIADPDADLLARTAACRNEMTPPMLLVSKVKLDLITTKVESRTGSASFSVPIATGATFGPSFSAGSGSTNTQSLTFYQSPVYYDHQAKGFDSTKLGTPLERHGPLYEVLMSFRRALISGSLTYPCFSAPTADDGSPDKGSSNTIAIGFEAQGDVKVGVGLKLTVVGFDAGQSQKWTSGNTITVTFKVVGANHQQKPTEPGDRWIIWGNPPDTQWIR